MKSADRQPRKNVVVMAVLRLGRVLLWRPQNGLKLD